MVNRRRGEGFGETASTFQRRETTQAGRLRAVQASVAKTHFAQLLDDVERGETIVILRHGKAVARIVPDPEESWRRQREAVDNLKRLGEEIRARHGGLTVEEIISSIHEGHKY